MQLSRTIPCVRAGESRSVDDSRDQRRPVGGTLDVAALYRRYGDMVSGRCRSLLGNAADAQEAAQEVFLQVHRRRDRWRGDARPSTYLYRAATNICLNRLRSKRRHPEDLVEELPRQIGEKGLVDAVHMRQAVETLLAGEDERTTACVVYYYMDGMTHAEAGEMLGISGAAVRKRIGRFKKRARDKLPDWLEEDP